MSRPKQTPVTIIYDFDGTLAKGNIQENSFIPKLGIDKDEFWDKVKNLKKNNKMDEILAYMFLLISEAKSTDNVKINKDSFKKHGKNIKYFDEVEKFFSRINKYAKSKKIKLFHYIISSGTKEMIEGTSIAKYFEVIYASSFKYDQHDVAEWPALAINYTAKTQYLFRINKGIKSSWDTEEINKYTPEKDRPMPFENMIYLGDGETDIPAMKLVKNKGGTSIGVYPPSTKNAKSKVQQLLSDNRVNYIAVANYSENSDIDQIIKAVIGRIALKASLSKFGN